METTGHDSGLHIDFGCLVFEQQIGNTLKVFQCQCFLMMLGQQIAKERCVHLNLKALLNS